MRNYWRGAGNLSDAELLAIFLRTGVKGKSAVDLARELLYYFGDLRALLTADQKGLYAGKELGEAKFVQLQAVLEITRRHLLETVKRGDPLSNPNETRNYIAMRLRDYAFKVFAALFLGNCYRVIAFEELSRDPLTAPVCIGAAW